MDKRNLKLNRLIEQVCRAYAKLSMINAGLADQSQKKKTEQRYETAKQELLDFVGIAK